MSASNVLRAAQLIFSRLPARQWTDALLIAEKLYHAGMLAIETSYPDESSDHENNASAAPDREFAIRTICSMLNVSRLAAEATADAIAKHDHAPGADDLERPPNACGCKPVPVSRYKFEEGGPWLCSRCNKPA